MALQQVGTEPGGAAALHLVMQQDSATGGTTTVISASRVNPGLTGTALPCSWLLGRQTCSDIREVGEERSHYCSGFSDLNYRNPGRLSLCIFDPFSGT